MGGFNSGRGRSEPAGLPRSRVRKSLRRRMHEKDGSEPVRHLGSKLLLTGAGIIAAAGVTACMTGQNQTTLDAITGNSTQPYVEAFLEFRGPQERWAGPANWVMHVVAKDGEKPQIVAPPAWMTETTSQARKPASQLLTGEEARAKLTGLASVASDGGSSFHGCMYPIHVRLIRADGNVLDKQGCRDQSHWAKAASEAVDFFLAAEK